ncbi:hypothetical protein BDZ94DRAFT_1238767 [Collybia nuda]|uniref:DUF6533 domain-containing protein n=1 Tax=Collybia nuda TaxID=64659 RepID=A0A9P5Y0G6_9AGAR|nr:hypothetical protein BDZ94DRAFT_1238767 [Collybia nuda]
MLVVWAPDTSFNSNEHYPLPIILSQVLNSLNIVALTILLFDHTLTFGEEVEFIWKRKTTPFSVLFLTNRYFAPISMFCYVVGTILPYSIQERIYPKVQFQPGLVFGVLAGPTIVIAEAILVLRVYAVYQRNKFILAFLASIWMVHIGLGLYVVISNTYISPCGYDENKPSSLGFAPMYIITTTMIGRLTLNLRKYGTDGNSECAITSMSLRFVQSEVGNSTIVTVHRNTK